jgi:hypothetical protein
MDGLAHPRTEITTGDGESLRTNASPKENSRPRRMAVCPDDYKDFGVPTTTVSCCALKSVMFAGRAL